MEILESFLSEFFFTFNFCAFSLVSVYGGLMWGCCFFEGLTLIIPTGS